MTSLLGQTYPLLLDLPFLLIAGTVTYFATSRRNWFLSFTVGASVLVVVRIYLAGRGTDWIAGQLAVLLSLSLIGLGVRVRLLARRPGHKSSAPRE
jgi:hypothetical protein